MNKVEIALKLIEIAPRFLPHSKPPVTDYSPLYDALKGQQLSLAAPIVSDYSDWEPLPDLDVAELGPHEEPAATAVATACVSCSRSHLSAVSGALGEAIRFAREEKNIMHPEVQRRIMLAEDEATIMERIDLAPDALAASPPEEREVIETYLPRIRKLRQALGSITSYQLLEDTAVEASLLAQEFRLAALQAKGVDLSPVMALAQSVQSGEIDVETAKQRLKEILPEDRNA